MALNPRFLTPASLKRITPPTGIAQTVFSPPNILPSNRIPTNISTDETEAKKVGQQVFEGIQPDIALDEVTDSGIISMATDNPEDVDPSLKSFYEGDQGLAQLLGAVSKLGESSEATDKLYTELLKDKVTPEESRKKVNEFFKLDESKETPVWADVALSMGLSLLRNEGGGDFLQDLGVAGERGLAVAKESRKDKKARSDMLDKLAFGVFREDEKSRQTLLTQLSKTKTENLEKNRSFGLEIAKYIQDSQKISNTEAKNTADAITNTLKLLPDDVKGRAIAVISKQSHNFGKSGIENIPNEIFSTLKDSGIDLNTVSNASNIVSTEFNIDNKTDFDRFAEKFPEQFKNKVFEEGKIYTVKGYSDKGKDGELTHVLSVYAPLGTPSNITRLINEKNQLETELIGAKTPGERTEIENNLNIVKQAIEKSTKVDEGQTILFNSDGTVAGITNNLDGWNQQEAARRATEIDNGVNNFVRAASIGDQILQTIASQPIDAEAGVLGIIGNVSNTINGARGQLNAAVSFIGNIHGDEVVDRYANRNDFTHLYGSQERAMNGETSGSIFKRFDELTKDRQELRSAIYDYAFALAGTRETGKLTDKDVANAMITLGGGDVAEGKWFASKDALVTGVSAALNLAANGLAPKWNSTMQKSISSAVRSGDMTQAEAEAEYKFDPIKLVRGRALDNTLFQRIIFEKGKVGYQSIEAYRGDGGGAIDNSGGNNAQLQSYKTILNNYAARNKLDPSDPSYLSTDKLQEFINTIPVDIQRQLRGE